MKTVNSIAAVGLFATLYATNAMGQGNPLAVAPIQNWSYYRHSSTPTEGYLRGQAGILSAIGQTNYANSLAAVNFQEAYRRQLENSRLYVQVFFERHELARQYREKYNPAPPTKEQWARITEMSLPDRLTKEQYDPVTGRLVWPHILRTEEYATLRDRVDLLIASRTPENSGDGSPSHKELSQLVDALKRLLRGNIDKVTPQQYANAKWFLVSLDYEAELPIAGTEPKNPAKPAAPAESETPATPAPAAATIPAAATPETAS